MKERSLTHTSIAIALPSMIGFAVEYAYQLIDAFWVAKLGTGFPTAVVIAGALLALLMSFNEIIGVGSLPIFSQVYGSKDTEKTGIVILQGILFKLFIGLICSGIFLLCITFCLEFYTKDSDILKITREYGFIIWLSLPLIMPYASILTALRTIGRSKATMVVSLYCAVFNIILDPVLIFGAGSSAHIKADFTALFGIPLLGAGSAPLLGLIDIPGYGVRGAAFATVFTQFLGLVGAAFILSRARKEQGIHVFSLKKIRLDFPLYWKFFIIGLPAGLIAVIWHIEQNVLAASITAYGAVISDGYAISSRIRELIFMAMFGLLIGSSIACGQFIGARKINQIRNEMKRLVSASVILLCILAVPIFYFAELILKSFSAQPDTVSAGTLFLRFFCMTSLLMCASLSFESVFQGAGRNMPLLVVNSVIILCIELPIIIVVTRFFRLGPSGLCLFMLIPIAIHLVAMFRLFETPLWEECVDTTR